MVATAAAVTVVVAVKAMGAVATEAVVAATEAVEVEAATGAGVRTAVRHVAVTSDRQQRAPEAEGCCRGPRVQRAGCRGPGDRGGHGARGGTMAEGAAGPAPARRGVACFGVACYRRGLERC